MSWTSLCSGGNEGDRFCRMPSFTSFFHAERLVQKASRVTSR